MKCARGLVPFVLLVLLVPACNPGGAGDPPPVGDPPITPAELTISVVPEGASVLLDGEPRGTAPLVLSVTPGEHQVDVNAPGFMPVSRTVQALSGTPVAIDVALQPMTATPNWIGTPQPQQNVVQLEE